MRPPIIGHRIKWRANLMGCVEAGLRHGFLLGLLAVGVAYYPNVLDWWTAQLVRIVALSAAFLQAGPASRALRRAFHHVEVGPAVTPLHEVRP